VAAVALADHDFARLRAVDLHVAGEHHDVLAGELREEQRFSDETVYLLGDRRALADTLEVRESSGVVRGRLDRRLLHRVSGPFRFIRLRLSAGGGAPPPRACPAPRGSPPSPGSRR